MRTTVEISDLLLGEVREVAAGKGVALRTLVERGVHHVGAEVEGEAPCVLRRATFRGKGRQAEMRDASWETLRDLVYRMAPRDRAQYRHSRLDPHSAQERAMTRDELTRNILATKRTKGLAWKKVVAEIGGGSAVYLPLPSSAR
jgi:hypothetical protein